MKPTDNPTTAITVRTDLTVRTGKYVGFVASSFTFGRFMGSYATGYVTDAVGRKPVIVGGLVSTTVFSLTFALSPSFGLALLSR